MILRETDFGLHLETYLLTTISHFCTASAKIAQSLLLVDTEGTATFTAVVQGLQEVVVVVLVVLSARNTIIIAPPVTSSPTATTTPPIMSAVSVPELVGISNRNNKQGGSFNIKKCMNFQPDHND